MAFGKKQVALQERGKFNLDNSNDLRVVKEFEQELKPYFARAITVFGKELSGFALYLHENEFFRYSQKYPYGAMVQANLPEFRMVKMKWDALCELNWRRKQAQKHEAENFKSLDLVTV